MKKVLFLALFSLLFGFSAQATVFGINPGDLIKLKDDKNPATLEDKVVYYYDQDWYRHPFPNQKVFASWYRDFSGVKELTAEEMAELHLGAPITYRPGTRLVKVPSIPKVYAVEPGGSLRWIESEAVAKALYGNDWAKRVDDVPDALFASYHEGAPLTTPVWPTGTYVRRTSDTALFFIDGLMKRHVSSSVAATLRVNDADVIRTSDLSAYDDAGDVASSDWNYVDTSQKSLIDTLPRPQFDFPANASPLVAGETQPLAAFRVTSGMPIIIRQLTATIEGPLWNGAVPALTDIRFTDMNGQDLFGVKQLESQGSGKETVTFTGAYTMKADTTSLVELRATVAAEPPHGATFKATIDRDGVRLADGGNGDPFTSFYPKSAFPTSDVKVK